MGYTILFLFVIVFVGSIIISYWRITSRKEKDSKKVFGTNDVYRISSEMRAELSEKPKQIIGADKKYLPKIMRNFPTFDFGETKKGVENIITVYLYAINKRIPEINESALKYINNSLKYIVEEEKISKQYYHYTDIAVHETKIKKYVEEDGIHTITFQTSIEYYRYITDVEGAVISGSNTYKYQTRYNIDLVHNEKEADMPFWFYKNIEEKNLE